jgi:hypothetical protein
MPGLRQIRDRFRGTLSAWALTILLRKIPGAARMI